VKVVESMAINNVDINSFKQQLKEDGIQLVLILGKLFLSNMLFQKLSSKSMVDPPKFGAYTKSISFKTK
jgi:hypothetical protein